MRIFFLMGILTCFYFSSSTAQPTIKTKVDRNEILIGDQFKLTIEAGFDPDVYKINWPVIPDSLQHFEVVAKGKMDSIYNNNKLSGIIQTLTLTSFDSGRWVLPPFLVNFDPLKADTTYNFFTDSVPITVSFSASDTTSQLRDIKPIRTVEVINPIWYWIGGAVLLVALVALLIWLYRKRRKNKGVVQPKSRLSPYDAAMKELGELKSFDLSDSTAVKLYHTRLSEILKRYLSLSEGRNYENQTTGDTLIWLRDQSLNQDMLTKAATSLRCNDAVKFARYMPPLHESEQSLVAIKEVINTVQSELLGTQNNK